MKTDEGICADFTNILIKMCLLMFCGKRTKQKYKQKKPKSKRFYIKQIGKEIK